MASIKSFITMSSLKQIHTEDLAKFLTPIKQILIEKNLWSAEDGKQRFDYQKLARYLHENCPDEIETKLYTFHSIAKPEWLEGIDAKLNELGIEFNMLADVYEKSAILVETSIEACNLVASKYMAKEQHTYVHYKPTSPHAVHPLSLAQIEAIKTALKGFFASTGKSDHIAIYPHEIAEFAFYCVSHGSPKTREHSVGEEQKVHTFRPELVDVIRVNLENGEISVFTKKCSAKSLKDNYIKVFGNILLPSVMYVENHKYNLNALKNRKALSLGELSESIFKVEIDSFSYIDSNGCKKDCSRNTSAELFSCMESNVNFVSVEFAFIFTPNGKRYKARISSASKSAYPTGADEKLIDQFFIQNGFIIGEENAEDFTMVSERALSAVR